MADKVTKLAYANYPGNKQVVLPNHKEFSFVANDTNDHDFIVDCRGKAKASICIDNPTDKTATITLYGAHAADADIGDTGVFELEGPGNGSFDVATTVKDYTVVNDPFPWMIIRVTFAATPNGTTLRGYIDLQHGG